MRPELDNIHSHKVWSLPNRFQHKKPISVRWVFRYKPQKEAEEERFRTRPVSRGFLQQAGQDHNEISPPRHEEEQPETCACPMRSEENVFPAIRHFCRLSPCPTIRGTP